MSDAFLSMYFPPSKTSTLRAQIINFRQRGGESLSKAWDRYQELLRLCPHHRLEKWFILQIFYEGLEHSSKLTIDAAAEDNASGVTPSGALREGANASGAYCMSQYQWHTVILSFKI
jgi:Retrotransposon gag protein